MNKEDMDFWLRHEAQKRNESMKYLKRRNEELYAPDSKRRQRRRMRIGPRDRHRQLRIAAAGENEKNYMGGSRLPPEVRNLIYSFLFESTRISFGKTSKFRGNESYNSNIKPQTNALAILRTCRAINQEASKLWLGKVLFHFEDPVDMLDKLTALSVGVRSEIRHVRTGGRPFMVRFDDHGHNIKLAWQMRLLEGLRLDTLTVLSHSVGDVAYNTLEGLIRYVLPNFVLIFFPPLCFTHLYLFQSHHHIS